MQVNGYAVSLADYYAELAGQRRLKAANAAAGDPFAPSGGSAGPAKGADVFASVLSSLDNQLKATADTQAQDFAPAANGGDLLAQPERPAKMAGAFATVEDKDRARDMFATLAKTLQQSDGGMSAAAAGFMTGVIKGAYGT